MTCSISVQFSISVSKKSQAHPSSLNYQILLVFNISIPLHIFWLLHVYPLYSTYHHRLQEADEGAESSSLLHQGSPHCLFLHLLHQQTHVTDILHGTVQLRLKVSAT